MSTYEQIINRRGAKSRTLFVIATALMVVYSGLTMGSIFLVYALYEPQYGFALWEKVVWTVAVVTNLPLCKYGQTLHTRWSAALERYERDNNIDPEWYELLDADRRQRAKRGHYRV